jgi:glycogen debranching enzyme
MNRLLRYAITVAAIGLLSAAAAHANPSETSGKSLAKEILSNQDFPAVLERGKAILKTGLNAGSGYGEVWIRDLNTFIELALEVQDREQIRESLLIFFHFQGADGNIIDGYIPADKTNVAYEYYLSPDMPQLRGHKNTVETDQEASLVQAIAKYVRTTGDTSILRTKVNGLKVLDRLELTLRFLLEHRYDATYGLIWGATTSDWGDVQPEHDWGVRLDESSHRAIDIYDNAMFVIAMNDYLELAGADSAQAEEWKGVAARIKANTRQHLWDAARHKYRPHIYLEGSPFPADFDEERIYYHGGTAIAIEAGMLTKDEILLVLNDMVNNMRFSGAGSIGLTVYPPYPKGYYKNRSMVPFGYQNGGDWTWFGGRMIQQLIAHGFVGQAYEQMLPMVERVEQNGGFFEWYTVTNEPKGSGLFRGSAGVLGKAIQMFHEWAAKQ